jgi:hypothetical protein
MALSLLAVRPPPGTGTSQLISRDDIRPLPRPLRMAGSHVTVACRSAELHGSPDDGGHEVLHHG